jgi:hypothetical protein
LWICLFRNLLSGIGHWHFVNTSIGIPGRTIVHRRSLVWMDGCVPWMSFNSIDWKWPPEQSLPKIYVKLADSAIGSRPSRRHFFSEQINRSIKEDDDDSQLGKRRIFGSGTFGTTLYFQNRLSTGKTGHSISCQNSARSHGPILGRT